MKVRTVKVKTFEEADAATLQSSYETWRAGLGEEVLISAHVTEVGTNIAMVVLYAKG